MIVLEALKLLACIGLAVVEGGVDVDEPKDEIKNNLLRILIAMEITCTARYIFRLKGKYMYIDPENNLKVEIHKISKLPRGYEHRFQKHGTEKAALQLQLSTLRNRGCESDAWGATIDESREKARYLLISLLLQGECAFVQ